MDFISKIENINKTVNDFVWGPYMLLLIVGTGIFSLLEQIFQVRKFAFSMKETLFKIFDKSVDDSDEILSEGDITPFKLYQQL